MKNKSWKKSIMNNVVWVLLVLFVIVFIIIKPEYFNPITNSQIYLNIPMQASVMGVMTIGIAGTILLGDIDLSNIGMMAIGTACGILLYNATGMPIAFVIIIVIAISTAFGFINGLMIAKLKAVALIETLAMNTTLAGIVLAITRGRTIQITDPAYVWAGQNKVGAFSFLIVIFAAVYVLFWFIWNRTALGRSMFAVGGNEQCAKVSGINVDKVRILTFTLSGLTSGIAGFMLSSKMGSINSTFGQVYSMDIIAAAVIGGTSLKGGVGKVIGVLGGVLLLNFVQVGLQVLGLDAYYVDMATGLIILLAVIIDAIRIRVVNEA